jgi:hypothetical protein
MFSREAPKLWNDAIVAGEAIIHSFPVSLFHLLTVQEPDTDRGRRATRQQDSSPTLSRSYTPAAAAPTIVFALAPPPAPYYGLPQMHPEMTQHYFPLPPSPARGSSPPIPEDPRDIDLYLQWFSAREPHNADSIEIVAATLNHENDTLSTLEKMSEARIERHSLPAGLVDRMKGGGV